MISDVLFEAIQDIEQYQRDIPNCYTEFGDQIEHVKAEMNALLIRLDTPPWCGGVA